MRRILVITNNLKQASYRVRIEALIQPLRERGIEWHVEVRSRRRGPRRDLLRRAADFDAVLLQRKLLDPADARLLRRHARRIYFDVDDAIMLASPGEGMLSRWRRARRFAATAPVLDHVVAGNDYLADRFRARGCPASVLPTVVDVDRYHARQHQPTSQPRLVWVGGAATLPYLREIVPAVAEAARVVPGLRLLTIADQAITDAPFPVEHVPWSAEGEADALLRGDIGIAPMPEDPWTLGKCGFKILQYMAAGLPAIASPVGANAQIVHEGVTGWLPREPHDWSAAIVTMANDVDARARLGAAGRRRVEEHYSLARAVDFWQGLLESDLGPVPPA